jgi:hypothetical protein
MLLFIGFLVSLALLGIGLYLIREHERSETDAKRAEAFASARTNTADAASAEKHFPEELFGGRARHRAYETAPALLLRFAATQETLVERSSSHREPLREQLLQQFSEEFSRTTSRPARGAQRNPVGGWLAVSSRRDN